VADNAFSLFLSAPIHPNTLTDRNSSKGLSGAAAKPKRW
jgi:hypothetical protein